MGKLIAICRSDAKGTQKYEIGEAVLIPEHGIEGDAHAGGEALLVRRLRHEGRRRAVL